MEITDTAACYRAVASRDRRFDGVFYTAVSSTGIYCRPSCPARTPRVDRVTFYRSAAAAQAAGYRACKRCRPDATPGSPEWDVAGDVAGRAMRLISDGVVDREGVPGLARTLGYSPRHLTRLLTESLGAGPLALARARRAVTARVLVENTDMAFADIAFAAGFSSVRQFNETIREVYDAVPGGLRANRGHERRATGARRHAHDVAGPTAAPGTLDLRLAVRAPFDAHSLLDWLGRRIVPGLESITSGPEPRYARSLALPHGHGVVALTPLATHGGGGPVVLARLTLLDLRDVPAAVERCRRLLDLDADPVAVDAALGTDADLAPLVAARPGLRVPGTVDGAEQAVRAVVGQQVSLAAARTTLGRLTAAYGPELDPALLGVEPGVTRVFPDPATLARLDPQDPDCLPMPATRRRAVVLLAQALADGTLRLDRGQDRQEARVQLMAIPGIGEWTAGYVTMRALGDPDVFLDGDLVVRRAMGRLRGIPEPTSAEAADHARRWRPWRSYAMSHLWATMAPTKE